MEKYYRIANLNVRMNSFGRTLKQAESYRIPEPDRTDICISSQAEYVKSRYPGCSEDLAEYMGSGMDFYKKLSEFDGFMLHASAVAADGRAYLFSADPGTGKSTHTRLWLNLFGSRAYIINDDKPAVRLENGVWYAYGTPWSGKYDISADRGVPIAGIAMIERAENNEIYPFSGAEAIRQILAQVNRSRSREHSVRLLYLLDKLMTTVPIWKLKCNMDIEAAVLSYEAMSGEKFIKQET